MLDVLELDRRDQPDLAVHTPMVEPVDVLRDRDLQVLDGLEWPLVPDQLGLEQRVERLGECIVIRVPSGTSLIFRAQSLLAIAHTSSDS